MQQPDLGILPEPAFIIGGKREKSDGGALYQHVYPATGAPTATIALGSSADIDRAVAAARKAAPKWAGMSLAERRDCLIRLGHLLREEAASMIPLAVIDNGIPVGTQQFGPFVAADLFLYNAGWTDKIGGDVVGTWPADALDYTLDEPYGVVAVIIPWNGPIYALGMTLAPALAAGNTIVAKPPELAPWSALRFGELCIKAGLPPGVVNIVPGGAEAGAALTAHPGVDKIQFTGSEQTAQHILASAAPNMTPVHLELGGKSASLVFDDADLAALDFYGLMGITNNSGQGCINPTRLLVQSSIYSQLVDRLAEAVTRFAVGDPMSPQTMIGPVIDKRAETRILAMIQRAKAEGARLVAGGEKMQAELADGYFISPTIFADVPPQAELSQCEVFGPVLAITPFETEEEAIALANGTDFGLAAYLWTNDLRRAHRLSRRLRAGNIWVNGFTGIPASAPFGGIGKSGHGRLGGIHGIREFMRPKNVWISLG